MEHFPGVQPTDRAMLLRLRLAVAICVVLVVANAFMGFWLWRLTQRFDIPIHVSCSGGGYSAPTPPGSIVLESWPTATGELRDGLPEIRIAFRAYSRTLGSSLVIRHRLKDGEWTQVAAVETDPLQFAVVLHFDADAVVEYQALELVRGQAVAGTDLRQMRVAELVGTPDISYWYQRYQDSPDITFEFGNSHSPIPAWNIATISVRAIYANRTEVLELTQEPLRCTLRHQDLQRLELTGVYRDGLEATAEIRMSQLYSGNVLFTRNR